MSETKLNFNVLTDKAGTVLFGKKIITLKDESKGCYTTDNLEDFFAEAITYSEPVTVFQNGYNLEAYMTNDTEEPEYNTHPFSICNLKEHPLLSELKRRNNAAMNIVEFSNLLRAFKNYLDPQTLKVLDNLNDLKIKKIVSVVNKTDHRGNFSVGITAESGKQDYQFPEQIGFDLPLLQNNETKIHIDFDFLFTWKMEEQNASLEFRIVNYEMSSLINDKIYPAITELASDKKSIELLRGSFKVDKLTDSYKYKESDFSF
jgi:hypothetical protein